jgi:hypothetical protein
MPVVVVDVDSTTQVARLVVLVVLAVVVLAQIVISFHQVQLLKMEHQAQLIQVVAVEVDQVEMETAQQAALES